MLGSSNIYRTFVSWVPIWVARRILCASPPDKVFDVLFNVKYDKPTSKINWTLVNNSLIIWEDIILWFLSRLVSKDNSQFFKDKISKFTTSKIVEPTILKWEDCLFNLLPLHSLHFFEDINLEAHLDILFTFVNNDCSSINFTIPKKSILYFFEIPAVFNFTLISSLIPYKIKSRALELISFIGVFKLKLYFFPIISNWLIIHVEFLFSKGAIPPLFMLKLLFGIILSKSTDL